ncbi:hypothetical protein NDU88_006421 [Pleurodeles waltl]|uniref:Uncharacterized protein n=1 Tax=Pleurodeles waltl TaxID=8319 RepID=A0AAV7LP29_PLEWA|nr:hypothetical protein NDU88_006421 [Pleurodeles waltl]
MVLSCKASVCIYQEKMQVVCGLTETAVHASCPLTENPCNVKDQIEQDMKMADSIVTLPTGEAVDSTSLDSEIGEEYCLAGVPYYYLGPDQWEKDLKARKTAGYPNKLYAAVCM